MVGTDTVTGNHAIPLRVLVVDDSRIFRSAVAAAFRAIPGCEVAGSVFSGEKALQFLETDEVDLITLDVEMPGMNGLEVLREVQRRKGARSPRVLMLSAHTRSGAQVTVEALASGAFGFVTKPEAGNPQQAMADLKGALREQVTALRGSLGRGASTCVAPRKPVGEADPVRRDPAAGLVLVGSSTGGPQALSVLLPALSALTASPVVVVQHMPPLFTRSLADSLDRRCRHTVVEAEDCQLVQSDHIYIARGGHHLELDRDGGTLRCRLNEQPPEHGCRPSATVLFRSAVAVGADPMVAAVLTGMGGDGAASLPAMKAAGASIFAQSEASCVVYGMPRVAVSTGCVDRVLDLEAMAEAIAEDLRARAP